MWQAPLATVRCHLLAGQHAQVRFPLVSEVFMRQDELLFFLLGPLAVLCSLPALPIDIKRKFIVVRLGPETSELTYPRLFSLLPEKSPSESYKIVS